MGISRSIEEIKKYSQSQCGILEAQLIITIFITIGLFAGAIQMKLTENNNIIAFILFSFGTIQLLGIKNIRKQYIIAKKLYKINNKPRRERNENNN